jgi:hypothetical protein
MGFALAIMASLVAPTTRVLEPTLDVVQAQASGCSTGAEITMRGDQVQAVAHASGCSGPIEVFAEVQAGGVTVRDRRTGRGDLRAEAVALGTGGYSACAYVKIDGTLAAVSSSSSNGSTSSCPAVDLPGSEAGARFRARLTGAEVVPPVTSDAHGTARFRLSQDGTQLRYRIRVRDIDKVTAAHLHLGPRGQNGPVVVELNIEQRPGRDRARGRGTIQASDLQGPLQGEPLRDLIAALENGDVYVNVQTSVFPKGEVRGQLE